MTEALNDEFTELHDATIPIVSLVGAAANGHKFLIAKSAGEAGLISGDTVRGLIAKASKPKGKTLIAYDAQGRPIGLVDVDDVELLADDPTAAPPTSTPDRDLTPADPNTVGTPTASVAKSAVDAMQARLAKAASSGEREQLAVQLNTLAMTSLTAVHKRGSR